MNSTTNVPLKLTSESIVSLAIGHDKPPPALVLLQLGLDPAGDDPHGQLAEIAERGLRNIASLVESVDASMEERHNTQQMVDQMCAARLFISSRRSDVQGSSILYLSDPPVVDVIDEFDNHELKPSEGVESDLARLFADAGDIASSQSKELLLPFSQDSEDSNSLPNLLSSALVRVVSVGCLPTGEIHYLQWWQTDDGFYDADVQRDRVRLKPVAVTGAVDEVLKTLGTMQG